MRKLVIALLFFAICRSFSYASILNFASSGNTSSNIILEEFVQNSFEEFKGNVVSYYYDIDGDGTEEIVGIVKSNMFYNLDGYKLIVLKKESGIWNIIDTNIYFDITKNFEINNNKVTYYKSSIQKSKKCEARISNKTSDTFKNSTLKKNIKNTHQVSEGITGKELEVSIIDTPVQRAVKIDYKNLTDRTKHYLEMK